MTLKILEFEARRRQERYGMKASLLKSEARRYGASSKDPEKTEAEFLYKFKMIRSTFKNDDDVLKATENVSSKLKRSNMFRDLPIKPIESQTILDLL